ncbi:transcriptional regulator, TetR family [Alkaliphilus metalliredigens QYMF]|uniref:Transcriptional regulator, TetR family n=1 Tax=Alkaliphilus metalliredigens (strain QYMF) TaxID=293826 RepID=A6TK73_ALKMQ|nr:TetR/AcrR family transcriptional regulator [Alkaliphilus metalliredigens]ABR46591.1 transcriptional regulator, TetR family [Alkaliphilus metalliredigens QYMF]
MARITEPEKMENIKKAVMGAIIEHGYTGMSIASISERAGVSPGYLYRHYSSKEELVQELVDSQMSKIFNSFIADIDTSSTIYEAAYKTIGKLFMKANEEPILAKFMASVVMDVRIPAKNKADNFKNILELASKCIELGKKTGEINQRVTATEVLTVSFTIPFRYLLISFELDKDKKFTQEEIKRITTICVNAMR